jgi:uncharacterized protein
MSNDVGESNPFAPLPASEMPIAMAAPVDNRPIRVWTVFGIFVATGLLCVVTQIPVAIAIVAIQVAQGNSDPQKFAEAFQTPWGFIAVAMPAQLSILFMAWAAFAFGDPRCKNLREFGRTTLSWLAYVGFALTSWGVLWLSSFIEEAATPIFGASELEGFAKMYDQLTWPSGIALVLFISLLPAFSEEIFFRGYMQRRLLLRWSPWVVLPLVSVIFAAFHGTPVWALTVLPLGLWFGLLAWRTGSLWPGIICHGFINGSVNAIRVAEKMGVWSEDEFPTVANYAILAVSLSSLAGSAWLLVRYRKPAPPLEAAELVEAVPAPAAFPAADTIG